MWALVFVLNLFINKFESLDQLIEIGHGNLEVQSIVTLIICQVVDLIWLLQWFRYLPLVIIAGKAMDLSVAPRSEDI